MAQGSSSAKGLSWAQVPWPGWGIALLLLSAVPAGAQVPSPPPDYIDGLSLPSPALAQASRNAARDSPKWGAHLDLEGKLGNNRDLGEADVFLPLWQDGTSLLFANVKARLDDNASREGNFGLGLRHMLESGWNLGTYGYFDRRRTETHNFFSQATFGLEALSLDWDLRANTYLPLGRRTHELGSAAGSSSTAALAGNTVTITTPGSSVREERSLTGFDAEIGWRVPVFAVESGTALRLYAGAYRFYADDVNPVQGPRGRIELIVDEVPFLWSGSRLAVGGEVQHDGPRGTTGFASARLRIPLQVFADGAAAELTPLERRMTDPIVRDIDIVSQGRTNTAPTITETATQVSGGNALTVIDSGTTTGAALPGAITAAGANSTVLLSGTFTTSASIAPLAGQTLRGGGSFTVQSASGRTATVTTGAATINRTTGTETISVSTANVTITGLTISNAPGAAAARAIDASGTNLTVSNNTLSATSTGADVIVLRIAGANSATFSNNTITANGAAGNNAWAVTVSGGATATISGNTLSASGGATNRHTNLDTATINAGSTGNTLAGSNTGVCAATGGSGSAVTYTNAGSCGP